MMSSDAGLRGRKYWFCGFELWASVTVFEGAQHFTWRCGVWPKTGSHRLDMFVFNLDSESRS